MTEFQKAMGIVILFATVCYLVNFWAGIAFTFLFVSFTLGCIGDYFVQIRKYKNDT